MSMIIPRYNSKIAEICVVEMTHDSPHGFLIFQMGGIPKDIELTYPFVFHRIEPQSMVKEILDRELATYGDIISRLSGNEHRDPSHSTPGLVYTGVIHLAVRNYPCQRSPRLN
jgi:hypothetical protein